MKGRFNIKKWLDGFRMAGEGILLATREKRFWLGFIITFLVFGTLMNLLASGLSKFSLMAAVGFSGSLRIIWDALIGLFGINKNFLDWLPLFIVALLQGILVGLIVVVWHKKRADAAGGLQNAGLAAGLAVLGAGCPTCGTTLLAPVIGALFSTGGFALSSILSEIFSALAIIILILALHKVGEEAFVLIKSERYQKKGKIHE